MHNTRYTIIFVAILTTVVALVLSLMATGLKPIHDRNEAVYNKKAILSAIESNLSSKAADLSSEDVQKIFNEQIKQVVIDMEGKVVEGLLAENIDMAKEKKKPEAERNLPVYIFDGKDGPIYIVAIRGSGLWDEIWGNIALENDFNTIAGAAFDHKGETPGLGAEIKDNPGFAAQFVGKKLYSEEDGYVGVSVMKGPIKRPMHEVDGISGATITSVGVGEMIYRGINYYEPYFDKIKK